MKFNLIAILLSGASLTSGLAQSADLITEDYGLGRTVGNCLVGKCRVIHGSVLTSDLDVTKTVTVRLQADAPGATVSLQYADPTKNYRSAFNPGRAWRNVLLSSGQPISAVIAIDGVPGARQDEPVVVTSNERTAHIIDMLAGTANRLRVSPEDIAGKVASLSSEPDPALAGYLFVYITRHEVSTNPDLGARLLGLMIRSSSVPPRARGEIIRYYASDFAFLSANGRAELIERLTALALDSDAMSAVPAIRSLSGLARDSSSTRAMLSTFTIDAVARAYNFWIKKGSMRRDEGIEALLKP
jgi:hypothetical protein